MGCMGSGDKVLLPNEHNTLNILLVGIGGSGKSTFLRQIRIINGKHWDELELNNYRTAIHRNIFQAIRSVLTKAAELEVKLKISKECSDIFMNTKPQDVHYVENMVQYVCEAWDCKEFKEIWEIHRQYLFPGPLDYYVEHIERVAAPNYVPTDEDIIRCRQRTLGFSTSTIYSEKYFWEFVDVGGQEPDRAKWDEIINDKNFNAFLFIVALDEFDTVDLEVYGKGENTKLEVSQKVWQELYTMASGKNAAIVVFFNKFDLFEDAINDKKKFRSFQKRFPNYKGSQDPQVAAEHIKKYFLQHSNEKVVSHISCALDTKSIRTLWDSIRKDIFERRVTDALL